MKKEKIKKFNKNYYLIGKRKEDGFKVWLEQGSFDCGWYWGIGYIEIFNSHYTDIDEHTHFNSLFFNNSKCCIDLFNEYFEETTLSEQETWQLLELMKSLYIMREYSDFLHTGGAYITANKNKNIIQNNEEYKRINNLLIPSLLDQVYSILGGNNENK